MSTPAYPPTPQDDARTPLDHLRRQLRDVEEHIALLTRQMQQQALLTQGLQQIEQQQELLNLQTAQQLAQTGQTAGAPGTAPTPSTSPHGTQPDTHPDTQKSADPRPTGAPEQRDNGAAGATHLPSQLADRLQQLQRQQASMEHELAAMRQQMERQPAAPSSDSQPPMLYRQRSETAEPPSVGPSGGQPMPDAAEAGAGAMIGATPAEAGAPPRQPDAQAHEQGDNRGRARTGTPSQQGGEQNGQPSRDQPQKQGQQRTRLTGYMVAVGIIAALAGFLFGFDTGVVSGAQLFYTKVFHLNTIAQEVSVAAVLIGTVIGAAIAGPLANALGRRRALIVMAIIFGSGAILTAISWNMWALIVFRIYTGIAVGGGSVIAPMYTTEQSPPKFRGAMVFLFQFFVTMGLLIAYLIDLWFVDVGWGWRPMFGVAIIPAVMLGVGIYALKETPRWLASRGRWDEASAVMERVTGSDPTDEMKAIRQHLEAEQNSSWRELFGPGLRIALITGVGLAVLQQFVGINTIIYYAPITVASVTSSVSQLTGGVIVGLVNAGAALAAIFLVDRVGRRPLLIIGTAGILACLIGLGGFFAVGVKHAGILPIVTLMLYLVAFEFGLGPVYWLLSAELFPDRLRGVGTSISTVGNWTGNLIVTMTYLTEIKIAGSSFVFWQFAAMAIIAIVFIWALVPETKNRPLEAIGDYWRNGRSWEAAQQAKDRDRGSSGTGGAGGQDGRRDQMEGQPAPA